MSRAFDDDRLTDPRSAGPAPPLPGLDAWATALASVSNAVVITDVDGVIQWVNAAFTRMSGYPAEEAVGATPRLLKSGRQERAFYEDLWSTVLAGQVWHGEVINRHCSGRLYMVAQTITPVVDDSGAVTHLVATHEDVTELREGQARVRALFDHALDAVVFFDDDGWCIDANPAAAELVGRDLATLISRPVSELLPREDWATDWPAFQATRARTTSVQVQRADGGISEVDVQVVPDVLPDVHVAICRDVTERRRAEAERDFQAQLIEAAGVAVVATEPHGTVTFWNEAATQMYGWRPDEAVGRSVTDLAIGEGVEAATRRTAAREGDRGTHSGEFTLRRRDGTSFPALVTDAPYLDASGAVAGAITVTADVTDLHDARQQAQVRASQQAAAADLGRQALTELDLDALFHRAVKALGAELHVPMASILELDDGERTLVLRAAVGPHEEGVDSLRAPNDDRSQAGYTLACDGPVVVKELSTETRFHIPPQLTELGVVSGMSTTVRGRSRNYGVIAVHTTTHRGFSSDDVVFLEAVAAVLGAAIVRDQIQSELQATVDRLARSDHIRTAFLRATSHELRTPLTAVAGLAETLQEHDLQLSVEQRGELLSRLRASTERLSQLIEDLLDVDRLESGSMVANRQPHDLAALVERVVTQQELGDRHLELDLAAVRAAVDPPKLERAIANLIGNAVRHTPAGSNLVVRLSREADVARLVVEDDGPGIDPDYLEQIFEPFVQGPQLHHDPKPGTGLGLTLAHELVALHDGTLTASNRPEGGSRFEVALPEV